MSELRPSDPFDRAELIILRVALILLLLIGVLKVLIAELTSLW